MGRNIAIKCSYNNGGEGELVGFDGTCSEEIIKWNIEKGRVWCTQKECGCRKYYDRGFKGKRPTYPCLESELFHLWKFGAGTWHRGKRAGKPIHLSDVDVGKIAILTTRFPGDEEEDRKVIGFFKIAKVSNQPNKETTVFAEKRFRARLPIEEAKELYFWAYYHNQVGTSHARWGPGLVRYLEDEIVLRILTDLKETARNEQVRRMIAELVSNDFKGVTLKPASGPRATKSHGRTDRIARIRKYGPGGEGPDHKRLKEWVSKNPEAIGLTGVIHTEKEYCFPSGDRADILFRISGGKAAVVEIETTDPFPGAHQALKYKILRCAERNLALNSPQVRALLVAWHIPEQVKKFCDRYGIAFVTKKIESSLG
jgi:hypothetical protein